jgi:hypothetical protein
VKRADVVLLNVKLLIRLDDSKEAKRASKVLVLLVT